MGKSDGIKATKAGLFWCNIVVKDRFKLCIAELIDEETKLFSVLHPSPELLDEPHWKRSLKRPGWSQIDLYEEEINQFFDWNFKS
jgi:hypothetical protein